MKKMAAALGVMLLASWIVTGRASQRDPLDPLVAAPDTHKLALENAFVRVLDVRLPPGKVEPMHRHPHGLSVYFNDWKVKVTLRGGKTEVRERQGGTFAWSEAIVHEVQNVSDREAHILRIELKF